MKKHGEGNLGLKIMHPAHDRLGSSISEQASWSLLHSNVTWSWLSSKLFLFFIAVQEAVRPICIYGTFIIDRIYLFGSHIPLRICRLRGFGLWITRLAGIADTAALLPQCQRRPKCSGGSARRLGSLAADRRRKRQLLKTLKKLYLTYHSTCTT